MELTTVADDVPARIAVRPAGLLSRNGCQQLGIDTVAAGSTGNLRGKGDSLGAES